MEKGAHEPSAVNRAEVLNFGSATEVSKWENQEHISHTLRNRTWAHMQTLFIYCCNII